MPIASEFKTGKDCFSPVVGKKNSYSSSLHQGSQELHPYFSSSLLQGMNSVCLKLPQNPMLPEMKNIDQPL